MALYNVNVNPTRQRTVLLRFAAFPGVTRERLITALWRIERRMEAAVHAAQPSKTGALRSQTGGRVYADKPNRVAAVVGVRAPNAEAALKAAALEYGSNKVVLVRSHMARLNHLWGRAATPMLVHRSEHPRRANLKPDRFLRDPFAALKADALAEMNSAVEDAAQVTQR